MLIDKLQKSKSILFLILFYKTSTRILAIKNICMYFYGFLWFFSDYYFFYTIMYAVPCGQVAPQAAYSVSLPSGCEGKAQTSYL